MLQTPISVDEFRNNLSEYIGRVAYGRDSIIIKKYNKNAAILLNIDEYERLADPRKRFSKGEWDSMFKRLDKIRDRISIEDQDKLEADIDRAVREVRAEKRQHGQKA
jgi:prevent-host-death family protein